MSKNLTRKGLALTAVVALGASFFAGTPALAADLGINNGSVSLAPNAGTNYAVLTDSTFVLKANSASGVTGAGKYLKFKVSDLDAKVSAASIYGVATSAYATSNGTGTNGAVAGTNNLVTVTVASGHKIKVGDKVTVVANATPTSVAGVDAAGVSVTAVTATSISYARTDALVTPLSATVVGGVSLTASYGATRGTGTTFVLDSKIDTNTANKTITLTNSDNAASHSADVTAWIDDNDNGLIDATEYQSPTRTVKFLIPGDVVSTTAFRPASAGDSTVTADVTTVPALNGDQIVLGNVQVEFGRPSETTLLKVNAAWSDDDQKFTATSANFNSSTWADIHASKPAQRITAAAAANDTASYSVTKNVATVVTGAAHGLQVGDYVVVAGVNAKVNTTTAGGRKVTAVPSTTSFSYAVETAQESTTDVASTTAAVVDAVTAGVLLRDTVQAGTVIAQAYLYKAAVTAGLVKNGVQTSYAVGSKVASSVTVAGVGSATVSADGASVYKGTTSAALTATVKNSDGDAVAAGVDVSISAVKSSAGTVALNGTTLATTSTVMYAKTDAKGQVAIALTNSSAVVGDTVTFTVTSQGISSSSQVVTWADKIYSILDLSDQSAAGTARNRAVAEGAAYNFDLLVLDQFKAPAGSDIRLVVATTGNTVSTNTVALTSGKASVAVADGGLTTGAVTVAVNLQKLGTDGIWVGITDANGVDWDGNTGELGTIAINYYTQTDAITLNADAANYPSSTVADLAATATAVTLDALDARVSNGTAPAVLTADKGVVSGKVTNASTGAAKNGAVVSITGAGLLFKSGDVWSTGSASVLSNDGTFSVEVYSASAGEKVVTVAVGAVTKTATVTFTGLGASKTNILKAVAGSTSVQAGRAVDYTATVTDKLGNAVEGFALKATVSGAGYFAGSVNSDGTASVSTDKFGKAVVKVIFSSADSGTATVKFEDNDASTATADNLVAVSVSTEVGSTDAQIDNVGKRVTAVASFSKGKTVGFYVNGVKKWSKLSASDADVVLHYNLKKGRNTVTVKISCGFITTEVIVVK